MLRLSTYQAIIHTSLLVCLLGTSSRLRAQEVISIQRLYGDRVSLSEQLLAGKVKPIAWAVYDKDATEKGIMLVRQSGEGMVQTSEAGGRYAAGMVDSQIAGQHYFYFKVPEKLQEGVVDIAIEYFDTTKGQVRLAYDGSDSGCKGADPIELSGGQTWNVVVYRIHDMRWTKRCNGGDFRIGNAPEGFAIGAVAVFPRDGFVQPREGGK